jgi:hypothetical protein
MEFLPSGPPQVGIAYWAPLEILGSVEVFPLIPAKGPSYDPERKLEPRLQ